MSRIRRLGERLDMPISVALRGFYSVAVAECTVHLQFATSVIDKSEFRMHEHCCGHAREAHHSFDLLGWRITDHPAFDEAYSA